MQNDFFNRMCKEAQDEIASGDKGWKEADTNTLLLACFGLLTNHLSHKITELSKPLWVFAYTVAGGIVATLVLRALKLI